MQNFANLGRTGFFTFESSAFNRTQPPFLTLCRESDSLASVSAPYYVQVALASKEKPERRRSVELPCFGPGCLNIISIDVFLHIFAIDAIFSGDAHFQKGIPQWPKSPRGLR
jgi:hypothetical protein